MELQPVVTAPAGWAGRGGAALGKAGLQPEAVAIQQPAVAFCPSPKVVLANAGPATSGLRLA